MSATDLHPAGQAELASLWPAVSAAGLFRSREEIDEFHRAGPWRVRIDGRGCAALVAAWREHLRVLAIRGIWCSSSRTPDIVAELARVANEQGFDALVSPLLADDAARPYMKAGMTVLHRLVTYRTRIESRGVAGFTRRLREGPAAPPTPAGPAMPSGVTIYPATSTDIRALLAVDAACFDDFWRYDPAALAGFVQRDRVTAARRDGLVIGYTLCTLGTAEMSVGRLAVLPAERRQGVGRALLDDALAWAASSQVRSAVLCTEKTNAASRRLYESAGMTAGRGDLLMLGMTVR
jgi:ribosomal protein S18 acetylase RimI-like enzyme